MYSHTHMAADPGQRLAQVLAQQVARVDQRIGSARAPTYAGEQAQVRIAADRVLQLRRELNLGQFLGPIGHVKSKPQFLLSFETEYGPTVLKVYGRRRPAEAETLKLWRDHGVMVPHVFRSGDEPTSWLLMEHIHGDPLYLPGVPTEQAARCTQALALEMERAHAATGSHVLFDSDSDHPLLQDEISKHLRAVLRYVTDHGYRLDVACEDIDRLLASERSATWLHGDLGGGNVLQSASGRDLRLIDACGYCGPPEFDAARWSARIDAHASAESILKEWLQAVPSLRSDLATCFLGLELLMESGVREIVKSEKGEDWTIKDPRTADLLARGHALLGKSVRLTN